jgi:3-oxoacyl-[acyl-carrier-protein] synthase I
MKARAQVVAAGAHTSIGMNALQTAMLYRAGAAGMATAPLLDLDGENATMCIASTLPPTQVGWERAVALALPALEQAAAPLAALPQGSVQLTLCLDERHAVPRSTDADEAAALTQGIVERAHALLPGIGLDVVARGGAAGAFAVATALDKLERRQLEAVVLGAVHSDYHPALVRRLSEQGRLFKPDNLDSLIPGEAAAFVALVRDDVARGLGLRPMASVVGSATGHETATRDDHHSAYDAKGLTRCIREAGAALAEEELAAGWALTDLTFEQHRVFEWQAMLIRTRKLWAEPYVIDSPAQRIGYLGAAAIPLAMALASTAWKHGSAPAPIAMAHAGSDNGERGAVLLAQPRA